MLYQLLSPRRAWIHTPKAPCLYPGSLHPPVATQLQAWPGSFRAHTPFPVIPKPSRTYGSGSYQKMLDRGFVVSVICPIWPSDLFVCSTPVPPLTAEMIRVTLPVFSFLLLPWVCSLLQSVIFFLSPGMKMAQLDPGCCGGLFSLSCIAKCALKRPCPCSAGWLTTRHQKRCPPGNFAFRQGEVHFWLFPSCCKP